MRSALPLTSGPRQLAVVLLALAALLPTAGTAAAPTSDPVNAALSTLNAEGRGWWERYRAALQSRDAAEQTLCLTQLALHWPQSVPAMPVATVESTVRRSSSLADGDAHDQLIQALFDAHYTLQDGLQPSAMWRELVRSDLEHKNLTGAATVLRRITNPYVLIGIRVDKRYSAVRALPGGLIDIDAALAAEQAAFDSLVQRQPRALRPIHLLVETLRETQRYREALQLLDPAIARIRANPAGVEAYTDQVEEYNWILDDRSMVLYRLARMEESVDDELAASQIPEHGLPNVSQSINLAVRYNDLGRAREARAALSRVDQLGSTGFGLMLVQLERLRAALQLDDHATAEGAMEYLRVHQTDSVKIYESALLSVGRLEEAQNLMIARLADPGQRLDALMEMQRYADTPAPPLVMHERELRRSVLEQPAVIEAAGKVGVMETFNLAEPGG